MFRKSRKIRMVLVFSLLVCAFLASFIAVNRRGGENSASENPVTLDFFQMREEALPGFTAVIGAFEVLHPEITVDQVNVASAHELLLAQYELTVHGTVNFYWVCSYLLP